MKKELSEDFKLRLRVRYIFPTLLEANCKDDLFSTLGLAASNNWNGLPSIIDRLSSHNIPRSQPNDPSEPMDPRQGKALYLNHFHNRSLKPQPRQSSGRSLDDSWMVDNKNGETE